jgi:hypothetical protein
MPTSRKPRAAARRAPAPPLGPPPGPKRELHRDSHRLEGFSDAVFGFSATLLVVSLEVPGTFPELMSSLWGFIPFAFSFLALVLIWTTHHAFFRRYRLADRGTMAINAVLLFVVLFYVYPLKFMTTSLHEDVLGGRPLRDSTRFRSADDVAGMFIVYGIGFMAVFACFALLYWHAGRVAHGLGLTPWQRHEAAMLCRHYVILAAVGLLSIGVAASGLGLRFGLPGIVYGLIGPLSWAHGVWSGRRAPAMAHPLAA